MPVARVNGVGLYFEMTGEGFPLVFSHEFAGDYRSWEPQVRFFSRRYRVITYNHRGYPPSEVPSDPDAYSEAALVEDLYQLLSYLKISKAHVAGLSMGANIALHFGIKNPEICSSLVVASCGVGSANREQFRQQGQAMIGRIEKEGIKSFADVLSEGPARIQLRKKDPRTWEESRAQLAKHSEVGMVSVFRGVQLQRPSIFDLENQLKRLRVPTLLMAGDEDEGCLEPTLFMKRHIPRAGLLTFPHSGHALNLEEPDFFNRAMLDFLTSVDSERWNEPRQR
jgi:pimeloyl-ACP methyl ester carboxylesterase